MEDTTRDITLNANTIITAAAVISAFGVVFAALKKITLFLERQKDQDKELTEAREEIKRLRNGWRRWNGRKKRSSNCARPLPT